MGMMMLAVYDIAGFIKIAVDFDRVANFTGF
jgi:hypothetical protein